MLRPHVVGIGVTVVLVETLMMRQEFFEMTEVPFAIACGSVAGGFADLREGRFVGIQPRDVMRIQRPGDSHAAVIASRQQG